MKKGLAARLAGIIFALVVCLCVEVTSVSLPTSSLHSGHGHRVSAATAPAAPSLVSPTNLASVPGTTVLFKWAAAAGAVDYKLLVSTKTNILDASGYKLNADVGNVTDYEDTGYPANGTKYYWWVWARNADGVYSSWSAVSARRREFLSTPAVVAAPALESPTNGGKVPGTTVLFKWTAAAGAVDYKLLVSTKTNILDASGYKLNADVGNVTSYEDTGYPAIGTKYYWWVWARNADGVYSSWSAVSANRREFLSTPSVVAAPALESPADGATVIGASVPFQWTAVEGAVDYKLLVSTKTNILDASGYKLNADVGNVTSYEDTGYPAIGTKYYWWVWARNADGVYSSWSAVSANRREFTNGVSYIGAPGLISPTGETSGTIVGFHWSGVEGAVEYRLLVSTSTNILDASKYKRNVLVGAETGGYEVARYEDTGYTYGTKYYWWVWAYDAGGHFSVWSEVVANGTWFSIRPECPFYQWDASTPNYNADAVIHEGTIDYSNLDFAGFVGVSPTQPATDLYADWGESNGWDNWVTGGLFVGDGNTNGDFLDGRIIALGLNATLNGRGSMQGWWDLGRETDRVVFFGAIDHPEVLNHPLHIRIYGSNTLWGDELGPLAVATEIYLGGWRDNALMGDADKNGDCWFVDDATTVFSLGGMYRYIKMVPWNSNLFHQSDPEIDAIAIFPPEAIDLEKRVNGQDANSAPGPEVVVGSKVTFEFVVTNTGIVDLTNVVVTDSVLGDIGTIPTLAVGASQTLPKEAVAAAGQHTNIGSVTTDEGASDTDAGNYYGGDLPVPAVGLEKRVNGQDADSAPGPEVATGSMVTFDFVVTNMGSVALTNVVVTDNVLGYIETIPTLAVGASLTLQKEALAEAGQHANIGSVTTDEGVSDTDAGNYYGTGGPAPAVDLEKLVNGQDADSAPGPEVAVGSTVTFDFVVRNTGGVALTNVVVTDNVLGSIGTIPSLAAGASLTLQKEALAEAGQHTNTGSVTTDQGVSYTDPGNYLGEEASPGSIGDFVWEDLNGNGVQDVGEPGLAGVVVNLFECSDKLVATTTTDANGLYAFRNIFPGNYKIGFEAPAGYAFSPKGQGGDAAKDSDAKADGKTDCFTLVSGQEDLSRDAGLSVLCKRASIRGFVWEDANASGHQGASEGGIAKVVVNLLNCSDGLVATTTTDANGLYAFPDVIHGSYKVGFVAPSDYVFTSKGRGSDPAKDSDVNSDGKTDCFTLACGQDIERDAGLYRRGTIDPIVWEDANGNGVRDEGEKGISDVTVELRTCDGLLAVSTLTDDEGYYVFSNITPGTYYVRFVAPAAGYFFSPEGQGGDAAMDSDANADGKTDCFNLVSGENGIVRDAGMYRQASIGDYVWEDVNQDGIQDQDEVGLSGVTVELHTSDGWLVNSIVTDAGGSYKFSKLAPGSYYLKVVAPAGLRYSPSNRGGDDALDSEAFPSTGETEHLDLVSGGCGSTWDVGLYREGTPHTSRVRASFLWVGLAGLAVVLAGSGLLVRRRLLGGNQ